VPRSRSGHFFDNGLGGATYSTVNCEGALRIQRVLTGGECCKVTDESRTDSLHSPSDENCAEATSPSAVEHAHEDSPAGKEGYSVSVVIPVYNEEESLGLLHGQIARAFDSLSCPWYEVIYIDDGSSDSSYDVCRELHDRDPDHVRVIQLRRNFGQTAALAAGFDAAQGDIIVPMDADLQNDPADIGRLIEKLDEGYDVVSGWRADRKDKMISRRLPSKLANGLISWTTGVHLHDYGCTLKAYRRDLLDHMHLYGDLHRFLPALARHAGATVAEIKVNHRAREFGNTKYGIDRTIRVIMDLITVKFMLSYATRPMHVFGVMGFIALFLGMLSGLLTIFFKVMPPHLDVTDNPWMYITIFFSLGGLQLVVLGLLGEIVVRTYHESQRKPIYTIRQKLGNPRDPS
jgi:glycosyltransferase involved in cell wall biosynthesis